MQHVSGLERARAALEQGGRIPAAAVTPLVAESWQRCRDLGLDPSGIPRDVVIPFGDVRHRRDANAVLRSLALAEMQLLHTQIAGSNFMIALADADGVVLDTISDAHFAESSVGRSIIPGSMWGESERGTNALGLVARERQPVAVYGREHYFNCHGHLSCMAAPILDTNGEVLGLLDASCSNEARQQHTHALVRMAAAQIENGLIFREKPGNFIFAFHPRAEYLDTLSAGLLAVSGDGTVVLVNRPGMALLAGLPAAHGVHFDRLFEAGFGAAMDGLLGGGIIRVRDRAGSGVFMVCRQIGEGMAMRSKTRAAPSLPTLISHPEEPDFVCEDRLLKRAMAELTEAAALRMPVHIFGETGTGKELMARHLHKVSRRKGEFVALNCGAVPEPLFIAEIFGHERGAYTNARDDGAPGLARAADGGTLFLDEVADIPLASQTALLRFLDSMEVRAVGGQKVHKVDVQIVSATNRNLHDMVKDRAFRADLLYRLNAITIKLPVLSERSDFPLVVQHLMKRLAPQTAITDAAIARLARRAWPGNIRELNAALQRALIRRQTDYLDEDSFDESDEDAVIDCCMSCLDNTLSRRRCSEIRTTYRQTGNNASETARLLRLSRTTVHKHIR
ncbi:transcriptional regulator of acetoin/glycerol metabolism [Sinorhizobium kostiense]|uniref:Transcriptional regulator of acetoin/glycerol metabolism n=1 Tax=Sinorhizobium kostiense TaxID=76747 RepID=A0ABS4R0D8_9HYPH|nr:MULTISPECIES: sigma 54-interacting transcriptional regulator [Sinorhizobium]MBP2236364.1 transcriptional regulator of acetoin/glycerol metabolism [Sinorhizobium kostiense]